MCRHIVTRHRQRLNYSSIHCSYTTATERIPSHHREIEWQQQHPLQQQKRPQQQHHHNFVLRRYYYCHPTTIRLSEQQENIEEVTTNNGDNGNGGNNTKQQKAKLHKLYARDFNNRRAAYNRQVSDLRKKYFKEYKEQREKEEALEKQQAEEAKRLKLMKQRAKNFRSVENMRKQEEKRLEAQRKFQLHLEEMAVKRQAKEERMKQARQLIIQELEQEAPLWLTTTEEVDQAFDDEVQQQYLWSRPNGSGILGAPNPSIDSHFWRQYESHTWHMHKTYPTQREVLLQELLDDAYYRANIDEDFWNQNDDESDDKDRLTKRLELEQKAKLRAMVRMEGRKSLLQKQRDILQTLYGSDPTKDEIPKVMPAPNVQILANIKEQEREGVQILLKDPTKFFQFASLEQQQQQQILLDDDNTSSSEDADEQQDTANVYTGPTLGKPIGLRDWLRESMSDMDDDDDEKDPNITPTMTNVHAKNLDDVFPVGIAKMEKPDTRTPAQKKREEREEKMWAAARKEQQQQQQEASGGDLNIELAADNIGMDDFLEDPLDYDENESEWDQEDNEEWMKGLDVERDSDILLNTPAERRFTKDDIQWVMDQMDRKIIYLEHQLMKDVSSYKYQLQAKQETMDGDEQAGEQQQDELSDLDQLLLTLTDEQIVALADIDDLMNTIEEEEEEEEQKKVDAESSSTSDTQEKLAGALKKVPGLTEEQVKDILQIQMTNNNDNDNHNDDK